MLFSRRLAWFLLPFACCPARAAGRRIPLHSGDSHQALSASYDTDIASVGADDELVFGPQTFDVRRPLDEGAIHGLNRIFHLKDGRVLRVASRADNRWTIGEYLRGYERLREILIGIAGLPAEHLPLVEVDAEASVADLYVLQGFETIRFTFADVFGEGRTVFLPDAQRLRVLREFLDFVRKTAVISWADDVHGENVVYTDRGWIFLDFRESFEYTLDPNQPTFLARFCQNRLPDLWWRRVLAVIAEERTRLANLTERPCERVVSQGGRSKPLQVQ